ncbi:MAG: hypothetical protein ACI8RD_009776, partial [Bacillariaceae sp.]
CITFRHKITTTKYKVRYSEFCKEEEEGEGEEGARKSRDIS